MVLYPHIGIPIRVTLALGGVGLLAMGRVHPWTLLLAVALWPVSGLGVTAGAHRCWTHGSDKPTTARVALLVFLFSTADQGRIADWCLTHKLHHRYSDTDFDPHNRKRGFWYSHFGWTMATNMSKAPDMLDIKHFVSRYSTLVKLHDKCSLVWDPLCSLGVPAMLASRWGDAWGGLLVAGALRWFVVQHFTFFVNSVAHGEPREDERKFDAATVDIGPRTSLLVTICALGEGWHDYHHQVINPIN